MYARAKTVWKTARRSAHHLHNFIGRIVEIAGIFDTLPPHAFDIRWRARAVHENTAPFFSSSHFFVCTSIRLPVSSRFSFWSRQFPNSHGSSSLFFRAGMCMPVKKLINAEREHH